MNNQTQQIDPTALNLSRSIRKAEGGDYTNTSGDASTSAGAYQFNNGKLPLVKGEIPANFKSWASEQGLNPNDFSQANQDHVAYNRIKSKLDSGQSPSSIAAEWNSGLTKGWENHVGDTIINGQKIHYDTPGYVNKVKTEYERLINGGSADNSKSSDISSSGNQSGIDQLRKLAASGGDQTNNKSMTDKILGTDPTDSLYGKIINNNVTRGIEGVGNFLSGGGADTLGKTIGTAGGALYTKGKDLLTGSHDYDNYDLSAPSAAENIGAGIKTVGSAMGIEGAGSLLSGAISKGTALGSTGLKSLITSIDNPTAFEGSLNDVLKSGGKMTMEDFNKLPPSAKQDLLQSISKTVSASKQNLIQKAIQELQPLVDKEQGTAPGVLSGAISKGKGIAKGLLHSGVATGIGYALGNGSAANTAKNIYHGIVK